MDMLDYELKWDPKELNKFTKDSFLRLTIDPDTIEFLTNIGLPDSAAPFLSFDPKELKTIDEIYSTGNPAHQSLLNIGFDGAGDPICIDTQHNCTIVALDHEDNFKRKFVNTSVQHLFAFLTIYKEFVDKLTLLRGDSAFLDSNFSDNELSELFTQLMLIDNDAFSSADNFWSHEINQMKVNKNMN